LSSSQGQPRRLSPEEMSEQLARFIASEEGVAPGAVAVSGLRRLAGGASRLLWSVDVELSNGGSSPRRLELVLRQDPPGRIAAGGMELEFHLLRAARGRGVAVPEVFWCSPDGAVLGSPFFAMQRLDGEAIPRRLLRDDAYAKTREVMTAELGRHIAQIHQIDPAAPELIDRLPRPPQGVSPAIVEVDRIVNGYRAFAVEPHPVLDLAERWLRARAPEPPELRLVHGDFRVGNVLFDEQGTQAVLDWELSHVGDPIEDLGWLCVKAWRFGSDLPVGGVGTREELIAAYESAGGSSVDPEALRFWEVAGNFKLALVFITQARAYLDGAHKTVELASLGRRTAEAEQELLELIA